jgi:hypothetical protein
MVDPAAEPGHGCPALELGDLVAVYVSDQQPSRVGADVDDRDPGRTA